MAVLVYFVCQENEIIQQALKISDRACVRVHHSLRTRSKTLRTLKNRGCRIYYVNFPPVHAMKARRRVEI